MTTLPMIPPLDIPVHGGPHGGGGFLEPLIGLAGFLGVVALLIVGFVLLKRFGALAALADLVSRHPSAEEAARWTLAERMARGEMSTEDFLDRATVLGWAPGLEPAGRQRAISRP